MPTFVLNRDYVLRSLVGLSVRFEKGQPTYIPDVLAKEAVGIGAECVDGEVDVLGPEPIEEPELTLDERKLKMFDAFKVMKERDVRTDFTGQGLPAMKAVEKLVGMNLDRAEVDEAWAEYQA